MKYDPTKQHRRSIRLKGYDYHNAGAYFVTICTKNRECVLDDPIVNEIIIAVWQTLPQRFPTIELDEFVVMPNHVHFVVWILDNVGMPLAGILDADVLDAGTLNAGILDADVLDAGILNAGILDAGNRDAGIRDDGVGTSLADVLVNEKDGGKPRPYVPTPQKINTNSSLGDIVGAFKSLAFTVYLDWIEKNDPSRRAKFWQGNYYEHIVRNERELNAIRQYIIDNPINWKTDRDNLENVNQLPPPTKIEDYLEDLKQLMS